MIISLISNNKIKLIVLTIGFILFNALHIFSQSQFWGMSSVYDDSAVEWTIYSLDSQDNEVESSVRAKWPNKKPWTEWQFDHLDYYWDMYMRFQTNPQHWFLDTDEINISIKQKWRNDITEWIIKYDNVRLKWKTDFGNDVTQWYFEDKKLGFMEMWVTYENDTRDWEIEDQAPNVPDEVKLAMMLITVIIANGGV